MNRTAWLQDRRMQKFRDVLSRWERGALSMMEAGELLGMSERQFRRYRDRYEEEGLEGLVDRRLGKPSPKRVPARDLRLMLELYRDCDLIWALIVRPCDYDRSGRRLHWRMHWSRRQKAASR